MSQAVTSSVSSSEPLDLIKFCLDEQIYLKLRGGREMVGRLHAYDSHCNIIISDAIETIYYIDKEDGEMKNTKKKSDMIFVRGDSVILATDATNVETN
ncbi:unnamed protein product [Ambrosiozyma monospora]|uniref:Unnamed protein product n=1 Tax=Ambrosiozyma monospora TaxID=43982 RepID=A0ACB5T9J9_AMBMO|nr:unnamed protein product [Ambrosiozyma monospora]